MFYLLKETFVAAILWYFCNEADIVPPDCGNCDVCSACDRAEPITCPATDCTHNDALVLSTQYYLGEKGQCMTNAEFKHLNRFQDGCPELVCLDYQKHIEESVGCKGCKVCQWSW